MNEKSKGVERFCLQYLAEYGIFKCIKNIGSKGIGALHHVGELPKGGSLKRHKVLNQKPERALLRK